MPVQLPVRNPIELPKVDGPTANAHKSIVDSIPLKLVLFLAAPYLAGQTAQGAVNRAHQLYRESRFTATIDILGEDCTADSDCDAFVKAYLQVIDLVAANQLPTQRPEEQMTISFKPSMFSVCLPTAQVPERDRYLAEAFGRMQKVVAYAKERNVKMTLEAEDHNWTDFHLDTYFALINAGFTNLGTVIQSRLFRTKQDLKRFDERCRVRMVIGIYNEPAEIAHTEKPIMKELLVDYAAELAACGTYLEIATHDTDCVAQFFQRVAIPQQLPSNKFEIQMLLGVPRKDVQQGLVSGRYFNDMAQNATSKAADYLSDLARTGVPVRMYLPFGKDKVAGPYCKRRLKANPNMALYGIKNLLHLR